MVLETTYALFKIGAILVSWALLIRLYLTIFILFDVVDLAAYTTLLSKR